MLTIWEEPKKHFAKYEILDLENPFKQYTAKKSL